MYYLIVGTGKRAKIYVHASNATTILKWIERGVYPKGKIVRF